MARRVLQQFVVQKRFAILLPSFALIKEEQLDDEAEAGDKYEEDESDEDALQMVHRQLDFDVQIFLLKGALK